MRKYPVMKAEIREKLLRSRIGIETLQERDIQCPCCGFRIQTVYSDVSGRIKVKCQKCKEVSILDLSIFRRTKGNNRFRKDYTSIYN